MVNRWWRNAGSYAVVGIIFFVVLSYALETAFFDKQPQKNQIRDSIDTLPRWEYSQLIQELEKNRVKSVDVCSKLSSCFGRAFIKTQEGSLVMANLPNYAINEYASIIDPNLINLLTKNHIYPATADTLDWPQDLPQRDTGSLILVPIGILIIGSLFWLWVLIDCATKEFNDGNNKIVWVIIIIFTSWIGALIYCVVRRPQRIKELGR